MKRIEKEIKRFVEERDAVLARGNLGEVEDFLRKHNIKADFDLPEHQKLAGMHKARTAIPSLPREVRLESARWLRDRGYKTMDDGDLLDA